MALRSRCRSPTPPTCLLSCGCRFMLPSDEFRTSCCFQIRQSREKVAAWTWSHYPARGPSRTADHWLVGSPTPAHSPPWSASSSSTSACRSSFHAKSQGKLELCAPLGVFLYFYTRLQRRLTGVRMKMIKLCNKRCCLLSGVLTFAGFTEERLWYGIICYITFLTLVELKGRVLSYKN